MRKVYIDSEFKCHIENDGTMTEIQTDFFDGMCTTFVEGYRFVPHGDTWVRDDGKVFHGEMIAPWKLSSELDAAQREYERAILADAENALAILLGGAV